MVTHTAAAKVNDIDSLMITIIRYFTIGRINKKLLQLLSRQDPAWVSYGGGNEIHDFAAAKLGEIGTLYQSYLEKEFNTTVSRHRAASLMLHILGMNTN